MEYITEMDVKMFEKSHIHNNNSTFSEVFTCINNTVYSGKRIQTA